MREALETWVPEREPSRSTGSASAEHGSEMNAAVRSSRKFEFERDSFAFANELHWEYRFDAATGKTTFTRRQPKPDYAHRCFVLTRAARLFLYHARFDAAQPCADGQAFRRLVREVLSRNPRKPSAPEKQIVFPGFANLREFSRAYEALLKSECGGAWRSYVLRSHWRMVFRVSRVHQARTATTLLAHIRGGDSPLIHLVTFPRLTINHGMVLFDASEKNRGILFKAYDPNDPEKPTELSFDYDRRSFSLSANRYWAGGRLTVFEIFRGWFM